MRNQALLQTISQSVFSITTNFIVYNVKPYSLYGSRKLDVNPQCSGIFFILPYVSAIPTNGTTGSLKAGIILSFQQIHLELSKPLNSY